MNGTRRCFLGALAALTLSLPLLTPPEAQARRRRGEVVECYGSYYCPYEAQRIANLINEGNARADGWRRAWRLQSPGKGRYLYEKSDGTKLYAWDVYGYKRVRR